MIYFQKQVDQLLKEKEIQIELLKSENERLRTSIDFESKRASLAVDRILELKDTGPITPSNPRKDGINKEVVTSQISKVFRMGRDVEGKSENGGGR